MWNKNSRPKRKKKHENREQWVNAYTERERDDKHPFIWFDSLHSKCMIRTQQMYVDCIVVHEIARKIRTGTQYASLCDEM